MESTPKNDVLRGRLRGLQDKTKGKRAEGLRLRLPERAEKARRAKAPTHSEIASEVKP